MKAITAALVVVSCLIAPGCETTMPARVTPQLIASFPGDKLIERIAVISVDVRDISMAKAEALAVESLVQRGFMVVNWSDVRAALKEAVSRDNAYFDRASNSQNVGRLLKVDALLILHVTAIGKSKDAGSGRDVVTSASVSARLVDSERGSVRWIKSADRGAFLGGLVILKNASPVNDAFREVLSALPEVRR